MKTLFNLLLLGVFFFFLAFFLTIYFGSPKEATTTAPNPFPVVGKTYQLDQVRYPEGLAICVTEESMKAFLTAAKGKDNLTGSKLLHEITDETDVEDMKTSEACTLISSSSKATVLKRGIEIHQAEFSAFPPLPMWGYYNYFVAPVSE